MDNPSLVRVPLMEAASALDMGYSGSRTHLVLSIHTATAMIVAALYRRQKWTINDTCF
jgi:hypothetical protein